MDIRSNGSYPGSVLSNLASNSFVFDGIECGSFEGWIQSLTHPDEATQAEVCRSKGFEARNRGMPWKDKQTLYWKGKAYYRLSEDYQLLLDLAYNAMYEQCPAFRDALELTGKATLTHTIGHTRECETKLTINEFVSRLTKLRDSGKL